MTTGTSELGPFLRTPDDRFNDLPGYDFEPRYLDYHGLRVHYLDEGPRDADPVLLLHGEPSWCYLYRKMIGPIIAAGHRVIAPDLIGFGRSDKLTRRRDYSYQLQVDYLAWLVRELDLHDITLFCQDWGGLTGLRVVVMEEDRFARVIAANTALPGTPPGMGFFEAFPRSAIIGFPLWLAFSQLTPVFRAGFILQFGTVSKLPAEVVAAYDAPFPDRRFLAGPRAYPALVFSQMKENTRAWETLARFERPFLTAFSDRDPILGGGEKVFQQAVAGARGQAHVIIKDGGHFLQEDQGEELGKLVVEFMARSR